MQVKICGLTTQGALDACAGAAFVGFNFCKGSPRYITPEAAARLRAPEGAARVGLFVNPQPAEVEAALPAIDMIQLHGKERPGYVEMARGWFDRPVIKAVTVHTPEDLEVAKSYECGADWLLLDGSAGGQGIAFNWSILYGFDPGVPWMLAGGLTPGNVARAIALARPDAVDVSSGVERDRGVKDAALIRGFIEAAHGA